MKSRIKLWIASCLLLLTIPIGASAQELALVIDLAEVAGGVEETRAITPGTFSLVIRNRIPKAAYSISYEIEQVQHPAFSLAAFGVPAGQALAGCSEAAILAMFDGITNEVDIPGRMREVQANPGTCTETELLSILLDMTTSTTQATPLVEDGYQLTVRIVRVDGSAEPRIVHFSTGPKGRWRTTYGFTFVPDRDDVYFSKAKEGEAGKFLITEDNDRRTGDFAPSILFSYQRDERKSFALVGGLGYDLENVMVLFGVGWEIGQNLMVTGGVAIHEQQRLAGRFKAGDPLTENLDAGQLHEKTFGANVYLGLSFRFDRDVFAERNRQIKETETAKAQAARDKAARQTAEKEATEAKALRLGECQAKADLDKVKAEGECAKLEGVLQKSCGDLATATRALAEVVCKGDPVGKAAAEKAAADAKTALETEEKKRVDACNLSADDAKTAADAKCADKFPTLESTGRKACAAQAKADHSTAKEKCLDPKAD